MTLFKSPLGNTEQEKALSRESSFKEDFGQLQDEWYKHIISSGMPADQVLNDVPNHEASRYSPEQEVQFALYSRWLHKAPPSQFEIGKGTTDRNLLIWSLFTRGLTEREIAAELNIPRSTVNKILIKLQDRCHIDIRNGVCDADPDSRSEINHWTRLQTIKQKHLQLLASSSLASTIVDSIIDSGCLITLPIDQDIVDAFNESTAQLALALEVDHV